MNFYLFALFSYSIIIAACIGIYRFRKIDSNYYPFIIYTILASLNEIYSFIIVSRYGLSNNANNNVYTLVEALVICWQFYKWNAFGKKKTLYGLMQLSLVIIWVYNWWRTGSLYELFHIYRIYYSIELTLLSLAVFNRIIFSRVKSLKRNTIFLVCAGLIILYSFKIITELFWLYGLNLSQDFLYKVYAWFGYINLIINLLFILAVIWIPKKPRYITYTS